MVRSEVCPAIAIHSERLVAFSELCVRQFQRKVYLCSPQPDVTPEVKAAIFNFKIYRFLFDAF